MMRRPRIYDCDGMTSEVSIDDWDDHWRSFGEAAEGNPANRYRQQVVGKLLGPLTGSARVLDIGAGQGELAFVLKRKYPAAQIRGLEFSGEGVRRAEAIALSSGLDVTFVQRDLLLEVDLPEEERGWATLAVCSEVLEHVDEPDVLLRNSREYLARGCRLIVTVPGGPRSAFDRHIGHRRHFTRQALTNLLEDSGYEVVRVLTAGFPFFNLYRLVVIARGKRLASATSRHPHGGGAASSAIASLTLAVFGVLFHGNRSSSPWGWQLVAEARPRDVGDGIRG